MARGVDDDVRDDLAPGLALFRVVVVAHGRRGAQPRFHGQVRREEVAVARLDLVTKGAISQRRGHDVDAGVVVNAHTRRVRVRHFSEHMSKLF